MTCTGFSTWMKRRDAGLRDNPGLIDRGDERRRTAIHDRNFRTIDFDRGIIDAHSPQCSKHMLGGGNQRTFAVAKDGREFGGDHGLGRRPNFPVAAIEAAADKNKTCIDRCRSEGQTNG